MPQNESLTSSILEFHRMPDPKTAVKIHQVGLFWCDKAIPSKALDRLREIAKFYTEERIQTYLLPLISPTNQNQKSQVSLRSLDWLVTNYSKKSSIVYRWQIFQNKDKELVNIHDDYRSWLKYFRRRLFDPFRRRQRIYFEIDNILHCTTVAQLNFLYFAWQYGIHHYATENIQFIIQDMKNGVSKKKQKTLEEVHQSEDGRKRKRRELSKAPTSKCFVYKIQGKVQFESSDNEQSDPEDQDDPDDQEDPETQDLINV